MMNQCANPKCSKPLRYLREGRIFVFEVPDSRPERSPGGVRGRRMEHYWLCGECSQTMLLEKTLDQNIRLVAKAGLRYTRQEARTSEAIAS